MESRYPYVREFIDFYQNQQGAARNTLTRYEGDIKVFLDWMLSNFGYSNPAKITTDTIFKYRDFLEEKRYRMNSIKTFFKGIKMYLDWCFQNKLIPTDPWPKHLRIKGALPLPGVVPTPSQIFRIRLKPSVRIESAFAMEMMLSSGMRREELLQIRACDFNFEDKPFDKELQRPSPYFAGSIWLNVAKFNMKTKKSRKVYFSVLAAKLLPHFLAKFKIKPGSNVPLFPWDETIISQWMIPLGQGIVSRFMDNSVKPEAEKPRQRGFTDLNADELAVSPRMKKLISRRQKAEHALPENIRKASQPQRESHVRNLHPHALRHAFTNYMFYRNPMGERHNADHLRLLLGHSNFTSTFTYMTSLDLIHDDETWNRLWRGKLDDWCDLS